jgi:hypothetical protein
VRVAELLNLLCHVEVEDEISIGDGELGAHRRVVVDLDEHQRHDRQLGRLAVSRLFGRHC